MVSVQAIISSVTGFISGGRVTMMALVENKTISGRIKMEGYRYDGATCYYYSQSEQTRIIDITKWNLKEMAYADVPAVFGFGCMQTWGCTVGGTVPCPSWDSAAGSYLWDIPIIAANTTAPGAVPNFTVTPLSGAINLTWGIVPDPGGMSEVFAYEIIVNDGAAVVAGGFADAGQRNVTIGGLTNGKTYTVKIRALSHNGVPGAISSTTAIPVGATKPQIFSMCWGTAITPPCGNSPGQPPITPGTSFKIATDIYNIGPTGKVRAVFKIDGVPIGTVENPSLQTCSGPNCMTIQWYPTVNYTMPNKNVTLTLETYGWDGTNWTSAPTDTRTLTISASTPTCTSANIGTYPTTVKAGDKVSIPVSVTPTTQPFTVKLKLQDGTVIGQCVTSNGGCTIIWDTTGKTPGTYYFNASVEGQCISTGYASLGISPAINQWNVNIYVKDSVTNSPIEGATVTIGTQSKVIDATGYVQFRVDEGTINISISKTGYNTKTTVEPVFSDKTFNYVISPTGIAKGNIHFVSLPVGAEIFIDSADQGVKTINTVFNIPAGEHTFTLKLAGYNDFTGPVTVVGGSTVEVYTVLDPSTPGTGSLYVASTPVAADITIDGQPQNVKTPATITGLTPGSHEVKLTRIGYEDLTQTVTITAGTTTYLNVKLTVLPGIGTLEISSTPAGARVFIDGADAQKVTPATITNLSSGDHTYKLFLAGYKDAAGTFTIEPGMTTTVSVPLTKTEAKAGAGMFLGISLLGMGVLGAVIIATREKKPEYTLPKYKEG